MNKLSSTVVALSTVAALALVSGSAQAQNIVQNPGFETGSLGPWVATAPNWNWAVTSSDAHTGQFAVTTGCVGATCIGGAAPSRLFQDLATVVGQSYDLSYFFHDAGSPFELAVLWNGVVVQDFTSPNSATYNQYVVNGLVATGSVTRLEFQGRQDPSFNRLDDISVVASGVTAAPEPGSMTLLATGLAGLVGAVRRKRRA